MASTEVNLEDLTAVTEQGMFGILGTDDPNLRPMKKNRDDEKKRKAGQHPSTTVEIYDGSQK